MKEVTEIKAGQVWLWRFDQTLDVKPVMIVYIDEHIVRVRWWCNDSKGFVEHFTTKSLDRCDMEFYTDSMSEEDFKQWCKTGENPTLKSETETKSVDENILQPSADGEKGYLVTQKLQYAATNDPVHHPSHYTSHPSGIECIEITRHMSFNIGNAIKYLWRNGKKDGQPAIQDLQKAVWYIQDEIRRLSK